nr:NS3 [Umatilla virus]
MLEAAERAQERSFTKQEIQHEKDQIPLIERGPNYETGQSKSSQLKPITRFSFLNEFNYEQENGFMYQQLQDKAQALNILTNAVTSTTGANETLKNEKAVFGATSDALKDDPFTRYTKQLAYETTIQQINGQVAQKRRKMLVLDLIKYTLGVILLILLLWNMTVETIDEESYKTLLSGLFNRNVTDVSGMFSAARIIRRYTSYLEMASSIAMTLIIRKIVQLGMRIRTLERDRVKREAYNKTVARVTHSGMCPPSAPALESTER